MLNYLFIILPIFLFLFIVYFYNNIKQTIYFLKFLYHSYKVINRINDGTLDVRDVDNYKRTINNSGVFAIKLVQWGLNRFRLITDKNETIKLLDKLNDFYENCPFHSDEYTKKVFRENFDYDIENQYSMEPIASGSIAQVYKIKSKKEDIYYAMKVVHPGIKTQIYISEIIIKLLMCINKCCVKKTLNFDLDNFFVSIKDQIDLLKEASYMKCFYEKYKENKYIVIPQIKEESSDIIIMTYENGDFYDDLNISEYKKSKIITLLESFLLNNMIIDKLIHADLHNGNWKVKKIEGTENYQLIIYDFGLCLDINKYNTNKFYDSICNNDYDRLTEFIYEGVLNKEKVDKTIISDIIKKEIDLKYMDMDKVVSTILNHCDKINIIFDSNYLTLLLLIINFQATSSSYSHSGGASSDYTGNEKVQTDFVKKSLYPYLITFCEHHEIFNNLKDYLKKFLVDYKTENCLFDDIEERLMITKKNRKIIFSSDSDDSD